jgi:predicted nuclease of predicted toxin-antitoxin system
LRNASADDDVIFDRAAEEDYVPLSADTDSSTILATRAASRPSLILFRGGGSRKAEPLASVIVANLRGLSQAQLARRMKTSRSYMVRIERGKVRP